MIFFYYDLDAFSAVVCIEFWVIYKRNQHADWGYFAPEQGSDLVVEDLHQLRSQIQAVYSGTPYFMLGHSMGSFLLRKYLSLHGEGLARHRRIFPSENLETVAPRQNRALSVLRHFGFSPASCRHFDPGTI